MYLRAHTGCLRSKADGYPNYLKIIIKVCGDETLSSTGSQSSSYDMIVRNKGQTTRIPKSEYSTWFQVTNSVDPACE